MVFFNKEIVSNTFIVAGAPVKFEVLDGNIGVIALDETKPENKQLVEELTKNCGRFGISKLSEQQYNEKKTLQPLSQFQPRSRTNEKLRIVPTRQPTNPFARQIHQAAPEGAAAADNGGQQAAPSAPSVTSTVPGVPPPAKADTSSESNTGMAPPKFVPSTRRISRRAEATATDTPAAPAAPAAAEPGE